MAQITDSTTGEPTTQKRRRRRQVRGRQTTSRSGAGAGVGGAGLGTVQGGFSTLTPEQAYKLGMRHGCELGGITWPTR